MDSDSQIVESFVKCHHEKNNLIIQSSVQNYYISAIYSYWDKYKNYINSVNLTPLYNIFNGRLTSSDLDQAVDMINNLIGIKTIFYQTTAAGLLANIRHLINNLKENHNWSHATNDIAEISEGLQRSITHIALLKNNINIDENLLFSSVNNLQLNFNITKTVDIVEISKILVDISNKICISQSIKSEPYQKLNIARDLRPDIYPLINTNGLFGYNTYLYAYFNKVFLVGLPDRYSVFDSALGCSERFFKHDMDHIRDIRAITPYNFDILRKVYYSILSDSDLSKSYKEEYIHTLFFWVHETAAYFVSNSEPFANIDILSSDIHLFYENLTFPLIQLDPLLVDTFILHNGSQLHALDQTYLETIKHIQYGYDSVEEILKENYSSNEFSNPETILYYMKICNLRLMRYISLLL